MNTNSLDPYSGSTNGEYVFWVVQEEQEGWGLGPVVVLRQKAVERRQVRQNSSQEVLSEAPRFGQHEAHMDQEELIGSGLEHQNSTQEHWL